MLETTSIDIAAVLDLTFESIEDSIANRSTSEKWEFLAKTIGLFCYHLGRRFGYGQAEEDAHDQEREYKENREAAQSLASTGATHA